MEIVGRTNFAGYMGFTFPLVVDNSSTFDQLRATICGKYPWGLYDAVEIRPRSQKISNPTGSRPSGYKASEKLRTKTRAISSSCKTPTTPSANVEFEHSWSKTQAKPSIHVDIVVEEAERDAEPLCDEEDEKLYPGYTQHNIEEDQADEYFIPAKFTDTDEDETLEEKDNAVFGNEDEDRCVMMYRGQLVTSCALDAHNWLFLVAYGVMEGESTDSWIWFFQQLKKLIGHPHGLVIHTDTCKGLETPVDDVFPGAEHMGCMRHLAQNFSKKFKGKFYDENLWPCSLTYNIKKHNYHLDQLHSRPKVKEYLEEHHTKIWGRALFNDTCKVDYVNNNLAEALNSRIKKYKGVHILDLCDKIRQYIMQKFDIRNMIAIDHFEGHLIVPSVMKALMEKNKRFRDNFD
ncbi:putative transposon protein [Hordeum vulgare]|nr:putative transposon protein [Hordeum vulgare]